MNRFLWVVSIAAVLAAASTSATAQLSNGKGDLRVTTYKVDEGTGCIEVTQPTNAEQFFVAVGRPLAAPRAVYERGGLS